MCDTVAVVLPEGGVLFAKNSDRDANEAQLLEWHPRRTHPAGASLRCTWIEIPQVRETQAILISRPFWMWGAEIGTNEHGLTIGNEAVFTRQPYARTGLTGMDLLRLALERARTAREGFEVITELLARHGQGGGCGHEDRGFTYHNSFLIADREAAFVLETAGRLWARERVRGARSISNGLTIAGFDERQGSPLETWGSRCRLRRARTEELAQGARGAAELMALLRDHGRGQRPAPRYSPLFGGLEAPCAHAGGLAVNSQTTASWVAELRPEGARHWVTATAAPCTSLFKPVSLERPLDLGAPTDVADGSSLFWRHERLHRLISRNPAAFADLLAERDELERSWLARPPAPEEAFAEGDRRLERWTALAEARRPRDRRPPWARRYWRARDRRAGLA